MARQATLEGMGSVDRSAEMQRVVEAFASPFSPEVFARAFALEGDHAPLPLYTQLAQHAKDSGALDLVVGVVQGEAFPAPLRAAALAVIEDLEEPSIAAAVVRLLAEKEGWTRYFVFKALRVRHCGAAIPALLDCLDDERALTDMWWYSRVANEAAVTLFRGGCLEPAQRARLDRWLLAARLRMLSGEGDERQLATVTLVECGDLDAVALARRLADPKDPFDPYSEVLAQVG